MFLKRYKLKKNSPLKSSETKKLRQNLEAAFPNAEAFFDLLLPAKSLVTLLKLETHSGYVTNVYCVNRLPMFFETENAILAPTLYALWLVPDLLPYFTTHRDVLPRLSNGADLMLPGIVTQGTGLSMYGHYKANQLVAVNLVSNTSAIGVGYLLRSSEDLYMSGGRGIAVKMLHLFGDKLWGHEPTLIQQVPNKKAAPLGQDNFPALGKDSRKVKKSSENFEPKTLADIVANENKPYNCNEDIPAIEKLSTQCDQESYKEEVSTTIEGAAATTIEGSITPEQVVKNCFLRALKNNRKNLSLPILTSNFYRTYMVPESNDQIDIKKTKYKKLSNFLNAMIKEGFIVVREETKGVDKITSIDFEHPELVNFITDVKNPSNTKVANGSDPQPLFHSELVELYVITDDTAPFFTKLDYKRGEGIPILQIKKIVREYISKQQLPVDNVLLNTIKLDDVLQNICKCESATLRDICISIVGKMDHSYQMCSVKEAPSNKPLIQMSLAKRIGNKKVTLISNIECYGIIMPEFIKLCKQGAAASTTIVKVPNQKREVLQIQGNQIKFIHNLLTTTYKVPPKYILGLELAKNRQKKA